MVASKRKKKSEPSIPTVIKSRDRLPSILGFWVFLFVYIVYLMTLSPGVSWAHHSEDSGDLITAAYVAGIPHPTGYPLFTILGWLWSHIIPVGSVAWRMNALSGLFGAIASGLVTRAVWRSFSLIDLKEYAILGRGSIATASVMSGLLLGFSTYVWQQSVITEVYAMNLMFMTLLTWVLIEILAGVKEVNDPIRPIGEDEWASRRGRLIMYLGLSWGLALTNHLTSLLLALSIILVLVFGKTGLRFKEFLKGAICWFLPLLLYAYMPIRSAMNPPLDYGDPQTLPNFIWMVTGAQFRNIMFNLPPYMSLHQFMRYNSLVYQLGAMGAAVSFLGLLQMILAKSRGIIILLIHCFLLISYALFYLANYAIWDPEGYLLSMNLAACIWAAWSIVTVLNFKPRWIKPGKALIIALLIASAIASLTLHYKICDLSNNFEAMQFGEQSFASFEPNAVVLEVRYERAFVFWYYREVEYAKTRPDVSIVYLEHTVFQWGVDLLHRKYPDLDIPAHPMTGEEPQADMAVYIIKHNIAKHPIYIGTTVNELKEEGYRFEAVGLLYRVYPPGT